MIIGLDVHGVLTDNPEFFQSFAKWLRSAGTLVYIISGPPESEVREELDGLGFVEGVHFDKVISVVDYLHASGCEMWQDEKHTWWAGDEDWWSSKGRICAEHDVFMHIDDSARYGDYFGNTRFVHWERED